MKSAISLLLILFLVSSCGQKEESKAPVVSEEIKKTENLPTAENEGAEGSSEASLVEEELSEVDEVSEEDMDLATGQDVISNKESYPVSIDSINPIEQPQHAQVKEAEPAKTDSSEEEATVSIEQIDTIEVDSDLDNQYTSDLLQLKKSVLSVSLLGEQETLRHLVTTSMINGLKIDSRESSFRIGAGFGSFRTYDLPSTENSGVLEPYIVNLPKGIYTKFLKLYAEQVNKIVPNGIPSVRAREMEFLTIDTAYYFDERMLELKGTYKNQGFFDLLVGQFFFEGPNKEPLKLIFLKRISAGDVFVTNIHVVQSRQQRKFQGPSQEGYVRVFKGKEKLISNLSSLSHLFNVIRDKKIVFESSAGKLVEYNMVPGPKIGEMDFDLKVHKSIMFYREDD